MYQFTDKQMQAILDTIEYSVEVLPEDISPHDEFAECEAELILRDLESNECAWFCAKVTGTLQVGTIELKSYDYLGACSYKSINEFKKNSGYFNDMCDNIRQTLHTQLLSLRDI